MLDDYAFVGVGGAVGDVGGAVEEDGARGQFL